MLRLTYRTEISFPGTHTASCALGTGGIAAGAWSWPLTSVECRGQEWVELYIPQYVFMAWCL